MEEILLALGLKSILSMILPIVVIIALIMIVSRLGDIRDDLKKIKKNIKSLRYLKEKQDTYESFDRDLSMSDEEKAIEIAKNQLFEHMQKAPERPYDKIWSDIAKSLIGLYLLYWALIADSGSKSWIGWIIILPVAFGLYLVGEFTEPSERVKIFEKQFDIWEKKHKKLQKNLDDLIK